LFPEDIYTKQDIYFRISEIIREKTFLNTKEELPHSIYV
jgi:GTP-binding protein Era